jgi:hypothetical protein
MRWLIASISREQDSSACMGDPFSFGEMNDPQCARGADADTETWLTQAAWLA